MLQVCQIGRSSVQSMTPLKIDLTGTL